MNKSLKDTKLKITPTCFGSYVIHHQGVQSCACLELLVVIHRYFVVCLVGVWQCNFEPVVCVCVRYGRLCHFAIWLLLISKTCVGSSVHNFTCPDRVRILRIAGLLVLTLRSIFIYFMFCRETICWLAIRYGWIRGNCIPQDEIRVQRCSSCSSCHKVY